MKFTQVICFAFCDTEMTKYGQKLKNRLIMNISIEKGYFQHVFNNILMFYQFYLIVMFAAQNIFPSLRNTDFIFTDENDAKLKSDILPDFIRINPQGVIIKIKTTTNILHICKI